MSVTFKADTTDHGTFWRFYSSDNQGEYTVEIEKDGSQFRLKTEWVKKQTP